MSLINNKTLENLDARGISYKLIEEPIQDKDGNTVTDKNGTPLVNRRIVISSIPQLEQDVNKFYSELTPCWFEGCEELRAEYNEALNTDKMKGCTGCQKGAIMRKFEGRVREAIKQHERHTNTGTGEVSRADGTGEKRPVKKPSVLRRAADRLAEVLGYRPR